MISQKRADPKPAAGSFGRQKSIGKAGVVSLASLALAILMLAFLISFALLESCSPTKIAIFLDLFYLDLFLLAIGLTAAFLELRKNAHFRLGAMLLLVLYLGLLLYMFSLMAA